MSGKITWEVLESYLRCRTKGHFKLMGETGNPSQYETLLAETRADAGDKAVERILGRYKASEVHRHVVVSTALLSRGASVLLGATVNTGVLSVTLDGLMRVAGSSRLGDFHYAPLLFYEDSDQ